MSASEAKAVASGNPDVFKAVTLKNAVTRFGMLKASHTDSVIRARSKLNEIDQAVKVFKDDIDKLEKDVKLYHENARFDIEIKGEHFTGTDKDKMDDTARKQATLEQKPVKRWYRPSKRPRIMRRLALITDSILLHVMRDRKAATG